MVAGDFRRAWPNALHRALVESCDLAETLDRQRVRIEALTRQVPDVVDAALLRLSQTSQTQLDERLAEHLAQIQKANALLFQEQANFMAAFAAERRALELARVTAETARRELDKSRQAFNQLGFFKRLFGKV